MVFHKRAEGFHTHNGHRVDVRPNIKLAGCFWLIDYIQHAIFTSKGGCKLDVKIQHKIPSFMFYYPAFTSVAGCKAGCKNTLVLQK